MSALYSINIMPAKVDNAPQVNKIVNVVGQSIDDAIAKVRSAYEGCEVRQVTKMQNIDIP